MTRSSDGLALAAAVALLAGCSNDAESGKGSSDAGIDQGVMEAASLGEAGADAAGDDDVAEAAAADVVMCPGSCAGTCAAGRCLGGHRRR
jgi:hypothetical protein